MCVASMIMDHYRDKWEPVVPNTPFEPNPSPVYGPLVFPPIVPSPITPEEIKEFRELLDHAREYDRRNNEPDCGMDEKREFFRKLGDHLSINFEFVEKP